MTLHSDPEVVRVLTLHTVRVGRYGYYVEDLVPGRAEGGGIGGEPPGRWHGPGAAALGLEGDVTTEQFSRLMTGVHPEGDRPLGADRRRVTVAAYDQTFCAPKSVSLLHALARDEVAAAVATGHREAVDAALGYLATRAVGARRSVEGARQVLPTTGPISGVFLHRTSRALDPHLHAHVVTANVVEGADGRWSALDGRGLFAHARAAGSLYHATLRLQLRARLGVSWEVPSHGMGDVVGVEPGLRQLFSQRSAAIREHLYRTARPGPGAHRHRSTGAFYATRPEKDATRSVESLVPEWRARAAEVGYDLSALGRTIGPRRDEQVAARVDLDRLAEGLDRARCAGREVTDRDVVVLVARAAVGGATVGEVEGVTGRLVESLDATHRLGPARWDEVRRSGLHRPRLDAGRLGDVVRRSGDDLVRDLPDDGRAISRGDRIAKDAGREAARVRDPSRAGVDLVRTRAVDRGWER